MDELPLSLTHDIETDQLPPVVPLQLIGPCASRAASWRSVRPARFTHEHVYWHHASLSVQVGLLDPAELPATGAGAGRNLLDPRARPTV
jgi:hypothetical protein